MPQFDIKLDDGRSIRVEGERAPTDDEASQIIQEQFGAKSEQPKSSALGSFGRAAATGVVPAAAGAGGFALGFEAGIPLAPFAGPAAPAVPFVTGAIGAGLASFGTGKAQQAIIHKAAPAFEQQQAQDIQQHPVASAAGNIAAALPTFELNPGQSVRGLAAIPAVIKGTANVAQRKALAATAVQAGTQAGLTTAQTLATEKRIPTAGEFAEAGVSALIYGNPRIKALLPRSVAAAQQATGAKPNASSQRQAAEIHGNVPPLAAEGAGQVPVEEGSAGVQSQAQEAQAPGVQQQVLRLMPEQMSLEEYGKLVQGERPIAAATKLSNGKILTAPSHPQISIPKGQTVAEEGFSTNKRPFVSREEAAMLTGGDYWESVAKGEQAGSVEGVLAPPEEPQPVQWQKFYRERINPSRGLSKEDQAHIDAERGSVDVPVEVRAPTENEPFAKRLAGKGQVATIDREKGTIVVNPEEYAGMLSQELAGASPEKKRLYTRSMLAEERNHLATSADDAAAYAKSLTAPELAIESRLYTGRWGLPGDINLTALGFEAIRRRMQRLARMDSTETAAAAGAERWGLKSLEVLNDTIRGIRETLGTRASKEGLAILDKVQGNLDAARAAVGGLQASNAQVQPEGNVEIPPASLRAYHGTPHEVDKFSLEKVGTGEGAQVYGWGLYFAEHPKVAAGYKKNVSERAFINKVREDFDQFTSPEDAEEAIKAMDLTAGEKKLLTALRNEDWWGFDYPHQAVQAAIREPENFGPLSPEVEDALKSFGNLYTVELNAEPHEFLDWDKPLSEQSPQVREAFFKLARPEKHPETLEGREMYDRMMQGMRDNDYAYMKGAVSKRTAELAAAGIKGVRYLDQGSRDVPVKTAQNDWMIGNKRYPTQEAALAARSYNYVLFDENAVKITDKNGKPVSHAEALADQQNQEPASLRRKSEKETQTEFFLPPIKEGAVERPGATDVGAKPVQTTSYLTPDKVNWERMERKGAIRERPFRPITDAEAANPKALSVILSRGAREAGSNRPESHTKNVTALFDRYTGRIDVVSTYPHSRKGVMLADPSLLSENASRPHRQLEALLTRYKPIYSISLKEPVQNFHERFSSMQDFQQRFGNAATEESAKRQGAAPTQAPAGAGKAAAYQAEQFTLPVETPAISPPESAEAGAIHDFFQGRLPKTQAEMQEVMTRGAAKASLQMVSGIKKMMEFEETRDPTLTSQQALTKALDKIYENLTQSTDREGFVRRTMGRFAEPPAGTNERVGNQAQNVPQATKQASAITPAVSEGKLTKATGSEPASIRRLTQPVEDEFLGIINRAAAVMSRWKSKQKLSQLADGADGYGTMIAERSKRWIQNASSTPRRLEGLRVQHGKAPVLQAARAVNASYQPVGPPSPTGAPATWAPNRALLAQFMLRLNAGEAKARQLIANPTPATLAAVGLDQITGVSSRQIAKIGRDWLAGIQKVRPEVEYANAHWGDADLMQTTDRVREAFGEQLYRENQAGIDTREVPNYMPGLYEGEVWDDNGVHFGATPALGRMFGKPKSFPDVYSALENGPFIPKSMSVADSAYNRIRSGMNKIAERQAFNAAKGIIDPATGTPIAIDPVRGRDGEWTVPPGEEQRTLVRMYGQGKPLAVRKGYENTIRNLYSESAVPGWVGGKAALATSGLIKHAGILLYDTFHPGRLGDYALSIIGKKVGFNAAYNALEYTPKGLQEAVAKGLVPQSAADWALGREEVNIGGKRLMITRQKILEMGIRRGLNANRISDALFKHMADKVPGAGWYNRMLFDKFQRGLMGKVFVEEFTRLNQASPGTDAGKIMDRVIGDTNTFFGSLGRQSIIKNPTARDLSQMLLLAPHWLMGLVGKEASFLKRSVTAPYKLLTEGTTAANVEWGTIGKGIGRGLMAMFLLTQGINLLTRHKLTFQNEEEGHKMDAWIPSYDGAPGHWISPLSIFMEITHDLIRLVGTKPTVLEATRQIGENKLGPLGRAALVLGTGKGPTGEKSTTSMGNIKAAAEQLAPVPISLGRFGQAAGHALAPNLVPPTPPGSIQRQMLSSAGIKSEIADTATKRISRLAQRFVDENGLRHTGFDFVPTDQPDYAKVRMALQRGDNAGAQKLLKAIGKPDEHVIKVMRAWRDRPWTGSKKAEEVFIRTLTPAQAEVYAEAQLERQQLFEKFADLMLSQR